MSLLSIDALIALLTLTTLEVVLGIDNVIVLALTVSKLPDAQRDRARKIGLFLALFTRLGLLSTLAWITKLTTPLFSVLGHGFSGRDLVLIAGGAFLVAKASTEIFERTEGEEESGAHEFKKPKKAPAFAAVVAQVVALDIVFSLDSVITAVGMSRNLTVMCVAVVLAAGLMFFGAKAIGDFIERHPSTKVLALSFLMLVGVTLVADGMGHHIEKGYLYTAMGFAFAVECVNLWKRRVAKAVRELAAERVASEESPSVEASLATVAEHDPRRAQ
ncbi:MAG: TerC family protein [Polyangiales bacterium]